MKNFKYHLFDGGFWVRIFGRGVHIADKIKNPPPFSERNGYVKVIRVGKWGIQYLPKSEL